MTTATSPTATTGADVAQRQRWMRALGAASVETLDAAWQQWEPKPEVQHIRGPEAGLVMVRGRIDAGGARFNVGEATVTRATLRLHGGPLQSESLGSSYVLGTDLEHSRLAAIFDGLLADDGLRERVLAEVIAPLESEQVEADRVRNVEARSTLVDFFTVAREHS